MTSKVAIEFFHKLAVTLGDEAASPANPKPAGQLSLSPPAAAPKLPAAPAAAPKLPATPAPAPGLSQNQRSFADTRNNQNNFVKRVGDNVEDTNAGWYASRGLQASGNFFGGIGNTVKGVATHVASVPFSMGEAMFGPDAKQVAADKANHPAGVPYTSPYTSHNLRTIGRGAFADAGNSFSTMLDPQKNEVSDHANTTAAQYDKAGLTPAPVANATAFSRGAADVALTALPSAGLTQAAMAGRAAEASRAALAARTVGIAQPAIAAGNAAQAARVGALGVQSAQGLANAPRALEASTQRSADRATAMAQDIDPTYEPPPELPAIGQAINANKGQDGKVVSPPPSQVLGEHTAAAQQLVQQDPAAAKQQAEAAKAHVENTLAQNKALASEAASWAKTGEVGQNTLNGAYKAVAGMVQDPSQIMPTLQSMSTPEMLGLGLGLGAGALGLMNLLGGNGGLGSMLMMLLGGGAAIAALGNQASGGELGNYLGGMGADLSGAFNIYTADPSKPEYAKQVADTAVKMPSVQAALPGIQKKLDQSNAGVGGAIASATGGRAPLLGWAAEQAQSGINRLTGGDVGGINAAIKTETQRQAREELMPYMPWLKDKPELLDQVFKELVNKGGLTAKHL